MNSHISHIGVILWNHMSKFWNQILTSQCHLHQLAIMNNEYFNMRKSLYWGSFCTMKENSAWILDARNSSWMWHILHDTQSILVSVLFCSRNLLVSYVLKNWMWLTVVLWGPVFLSHFQSEYAKLNLRRGDGSSASQVSPWLPLLLFRG